MRAGWRPRRRMVAGAAEGDRIIPARGMRRLLPPLAATPATLPALLAVGVFLIWSTAQAAYPVAGWAPGTLLLPALLVMTLIAVPVRLGEVPRPVLVAAACLAAFTVW